MSSVSVELINASKRFRSRQLFAGLNAVVRHGECLAVLGRNGSGKSTLLKMIAGLTRPSDGKVEVWESGKQLDEEQRTAVIGMVSPEIVFYQPLTALENICFFLQACNREYSTASVLEYLNIVGLGNQENKLVHVFSTGMRQRLKFALLMALDPPLLLLDEPSSNLDTDGKQMVSQFIRQALLAQKTVIIASNEPWETDHGNCKISLS